MSPEPPSDDPLFRKMQILHARRHLFLCVGPDCCAPAAGLETWEELKRLTKDLDARALRTKAACFRICTGGPWLLVYPEGIWYGSVTPERCRRIIAEHILGGNPVKEWIAREHPLVPE